jgi:hypothetical protein
MTDARAGSDLAQAFKKRLAVNGPGLAALSLIATAIKHPTYLGYLFGIAAHGVLHQLVRRPPGLGGHLVQLGL